MNRDFSETDLRHTRRALELAALGVGQVSPNPLVGCVIVAQNDGVVGEGSYFYDDLIHAEAVALTQAGERARGGTAYISLEPHDYEHRTPPCTLALINAGIKRVVCPIDDPNPLVSGNGFARLREHGIEVVTGILSDDANQLNEKFIVWHKKRRPFVHLKLAVSLDGRISARKGVSTRLSTEESVKRVQDFRREHDAILIGGNTAYIDDPLLTDRSGMKRRRQLVRVVLDGRLRIPIGSKLVKTAADIPTLVFSRSSNAKKILSLERHGVEVIGIDPRDLTNVMGELRKRELQSVLVEGGTEIAGAFVDAKLVDKVSLMMAPIIIGGAGAPLAFGGKGADTLEKAMRLERIKITEYGKDFEITGYPLG